MPRSRGTTVGAPSLPGTRYPGAERWEVAGQGYTADHRARRELSSEEQGTGRPPGSGKPPLTPLPTSVQARGSRLYISQASPADAGEYVCRASNGVEASITVRVTKTQGASFAYREWGQPAWAWREKGERPGPLQRPGLTE